MPAYIAYIDILPSGSLLPNDEIILDFYKTDIANQKYI